MTKDEAKLIAKIAKRASLMAQNLGIEYVHMDAFMDVEAVFSAGKLSRIAELADAGDGNFAHDVFGIRRHLNRTTKQLEGCFLPRYS